MRVVTRYIISKRKGYIKITQASCRIFADIEKNQFLIASYSHVFTLINRYHIHQKIGEFEHSSVLCDNVIYRGKKLEIYDDYITVS